MKRSFFTKEQNKAFISIGKLDDVDGVTLYVHEENSFLKRINKLFGKSFGTAVTNKRKEILADEINGLVKKYDLEVFPYSDFKSMRFAFRAKNGKPLPIEFEKEVEQAFDRGNKEFVKYLIDNKIVDATTNPPVDQWFHLAIGQTGPEAAQLVEKAKKLTGPNRAVSYRDQDLVDSLKTNLTDAQSAFNRINHELTGTDLVEPMELTPRPQVRLTDEILDYIKKLPDLSDPKAPEQLEQTVRQVYGINLRPSQAKLLVDYYNDFDAYSPPLMMEERKLTSLEDAIHGHQSIDFRGLGAMGRSQTAQAITVAGGVKQGRLVAAINETAHTVWIEAQKQRIRKLYKEELGKAGITYRVNETGDEMDFIPTNKPIPKEVTDRIARRLAARRNPSLLRLTSVPAGPETGELRQALTDFGEKLEKDTRALVIRPETRVAMKKVFIAVQMDHNNPVIIIRGASPDLETEIRNAFTGLVAKHPNPVKRPSKRESKASKFIFSTQPGLVWFYRTVRQERETPEVKPEARNVQRVDHPKVFFQKRLCHWSNEQNLQMKRQISPGCAHQQRRRCPWDHKGPQRRGQKAS